MAAWIVAYWSGTTRRVCLRSTGEGNGAGVGIVLLEGICTGETVGLGLAVTTTIGVALGLGFGRFQDQFTRTFINPITKPPAARTLTTANHGILFRGGSGGITGLGVGIGSGGGDGVR